MAKLPLCGRLVQYGYVVDDLEQAMADWHARYAIGPFYLIENAVVESGLYRGAPMKLEMTAALAQMGDVQIELLFQHSPGPSALTETPPLHGCALNHFSCLTDDFEADVAALEQAGHDVVMRGLVFGDMPFAYIDTTTTIGHFTELAPARADLLAIFAEVADAARDWNGQDPVRKI